MSKEKQALKLGNDSIGKLLFNLSVPTITAQIVSVLYNVVDRMYIGHIPNIGHLALTGVGITFPIILLIGAFSLMIGVGGAPRAAIKMGENNYTHAEQIMGNSAAMLIIFSVVITAVFRIWGNELLLLFGASDSVLPYALSYLNIYIIGTLFYMLTMGLNPFITTQGFAAKSMLTVTIGAVINIILDPIFIFVLDMGVEGAAWATILSQIVSAIWVISFLTGNKTVLKLKKEFFIPKSYIILPTLALGMSPFAMQSTESLLNICFNTSLMKYGGETAVGAMTILASITQMMILPLTGLTQGAQPIIGFNYGAKNKGRVTKILRLLVRTSVIYTFVFTFLVMIIPELFINMFSSDIKLTQTAIWAVRIYLAGGFFMGVQVACQQSFLALGQAKISLFLALLRKMILLIPFIYIFPYFFENKLFAVFLAESVADIIAITATFIAFKWKITKLIKDMPS